ncbi:short neuropeptide F [Onthophagus taurus]|uniref:short neuropeptide F n=1 Tax=Onthophagus taurus TaxID=166361 RepID=UPI0039BE95CD
MQGYQPFKYLCIALCVMLVVTEVVVAAPSYADYESSIRDLYELLMQKEALEDRLGAHQVSRKSNRSPSLRLRFGRRSDPAFLASPYVLAQEAAEREDN